MRLIDKLLPRQPTAAEMLDRLSPMSSPPEPPKLSPICLVAFERPDGSVEIVGGVVYRYATGKWEWPDGRMFNRTPTQWMFENT